MGCVFEDMHVGGMESCTILGFISVATWCTVCSVSSFFIPEITVVAISVVVTPSLVSVLGPCWL